MEEADKILRSMGFTEYQIKAWLTLLRRGPLPAEKVAELTSIPLPRVYDTIAELQKNGLVLISKTRPKIFKPVPPQRALEHFVDLQKKEHEDKILSLKTNVGILKEMVSGLRPLPIPEYNSGIWVMEKRSNMIRMLQEQGEEAKKEILMFSGDMSWFPEMITHIKKALKHGVKIKILMAEPGNNAKVKKYLQQAKRLGVDVRTGYTGALRGQVIDSKLVYIALKISGKGINLLEGGERGSEAENKYELTILDNPAMVSTFNDYFRLWWERL